MDSLRDQGLCLIHYHPEFQAGKPHAPWCWRVGTLQPGFNQLLLPTAHNQCFSPNHAEKHWPEALEGSWPMSIHASGWSVLMGLQVPWLHSCWIQELGPGHSIQAGEMPPDWLLPPSSS